MTSHKRTYLEKHWASIYAVLLAAIDSLAVTLALALGYAINFAHFSIQSFLTHQWKLVLYSIVLFVGLGAIMGAYRRAYSSLLRLQTAAAARAYVLATLMIFATLFLFRNTYYSNGALLTYVVVLPLTYLIGRVVMDRFRHHLHLKKWGLERTIVILLDQDASDQLRNLASYPSIGFDVRSVIDASPLDDVAARKRTAHDVAAHNATCVIYSSSSLQSPRLAALAGMHEGQPLAIRVVTPEVHDALTFMRLYDFGGIALSTPDKDPPGTVYAVSKRLFDVLISALLIIVSAPVVLIIGLAIRLESRGTVFFRQMRSLTERSSGVRVFKFRSMRQSAGDTSHTNASNGDGDDLLKSPADPRITRVGRVIRRYSLDELPQLYNVIAGQMSLVGPRPLPMADFKRLPSHDVLDILLDRRTLARPGITGLWQISGRSGLNLLQMVILDLYYAENQSFLFDLEILFETIPAVVTGKGAY